MDSGFRQNDKEKTSLRIFKGSFIPRLGFLRASLRAAGRMIPVPTRRHRHEETGNEMENFVLAGKAKTVFRLLELKVQQEEKARQAREKKTGKRERRRKN